MICFDSIEQIKIIYWLVLVCWGGVCFLAGSKFSVVKKRLTNPAHRGRMA